MSGHHPWPPGKLHDALQVRKREVFRFGDWSIYDCTMVGGVTNAQWNSIIFHCSSWEEWEAIPREYNVNTYVKGQKAEAPDQTPTQRRVTKHCNTNMTADGNRRCPECRKPIPDEVQGLWKMQNFDIIQGINSQ